MTLVFRKILNISEQSGAVFAKTTTDLKESFVDILVHGRKTYCLSSRTFKISCLQFCCAHPCHHLLFLQMCPIAEYIVPHPYQCRYPQLHHNGHHYHHCHHITASVTKAPSTQRSYKSTLDLACRSITWYYMKCIKKYPRKGEISNVISNQSYINVYKWIFGC